jgi:hypothetical protein
MLLILYEYYAECCTLCVIYLLYLTFRQLVILTVSGNSLSLTSYSYWSNFLNVPISIPAISNNIRINNAKLLSVDH